MTIERVCIYCGSSDKISQIYLDAAYRMGEVVARQNMTVVYGAGNTGMMGAVADGAITARGHVWGVVPKIFDSPHLAPNGLARYEVVDTMHSRKARMADLADVFIALPGGFGTFEELLEIITWAQIGIHNKPIGILNVNSYYDPLQIGIHNKPIGILNVNSYYDPLLALAAQAAQEGFIYAENRQLFICRDQPAALLQALVDYQSPDDLERQVIREN
jgi:uncharacterized protein (TIGR00730 family)